jgi:hypothetical protein
MCPLQSFRLSSPQKRGPIRRLLSSLLNRVGKLNGSANYREFAKNIRGKGTAHGSPLSRDDRW